MPYVEQSQGTHLRVENAGPASRFVGGYQCSRPDLGSAHCLKFIHGWNDQLSGEPLVCAGCVSPAARLAAGAITSGVLSGRGRQTSGGSPVVYPGI